MSGVRAREDEEEESTHAADRAREMEEHESPSRVTLLGLKKDGGQGFSFSFGGLPEVNAIFEVGARSPDAQSAMRLDVVLRESARVERYRKMLKEDAAELRREQRERRAPGARVGGGDVSVMLMENAKNQAEMAEDEERLERRGLKVRSRQRDYLLRAYRVVLRWCLAPVLRKRCCSSV